MNIWIINHYAMPPEFEVRVRNNVMAKYLKLSGHNVKIISASAIHNTNINLMENYKEKIIEKSYDGLDFVHIKTISYNGNGLKRILNHIQFPMRLFTQYKKIDAQPDVIICDLGVVFAVFPYFISRKLKSKFILEVRDLWPESIVGFLGISKRNPVVKFLYCIEKWMYSKSQHIIFSMAGGKDYIKDKAWDNNIDMSKIHHITNGVDFDVFNERIKKYRISDSVSGRRKYFQSYLYRLN
ncbi:glycosyltransferase family protein [Sporosarcina sp. ITBMC105]